MSKVLVTGGTGLIGAYAVRQLLAEGHEVVGLDNFSAYYSPETKRQTATLPEKQGIAVHRRDLRDRQQLDSLATNFDYIFHLAAQSGISATSTFEDYLANNVIATRHLLDFAFDNPNLRLFVNISTSSVYGHDACHDETKAPEPVSNYGMTKLAAEQLVPLAAFGG